MRIVFMGTPEFAASALQTLVEDGQEVVLVLSQPDKPKGRGYTLLPSEVKQYALDHNIPVETPPTLKTPEAEKMLCSANADLFIVAAYGKILPESILNIPPMGCVNIHASLLPRWRGAAPIQRAVMNGDTCGGITMMYMDAGLDTGDIILQEKTEIADNTTYGEYYESLLQLSKKALLSFLRLAESGNVPRTSQTGESTYAPKIDKNETFVSFSETAEETHNRIRGLSPVPSAYSYLNGRRIKLHGSKIAHGSGFPGEVLSYGKDGIEVACKTGSVLITELQPEGKGKMDAASFLNGIQNKSGMKFNG